MKAITTIHEGRPVVGARALHARLGMREQFSNWLQRQRTRHALVEGEHFVMRNTLSETSARTVTDALFTVETAERIAATTVPYGDRDPRRNQPLPVPHASPAEATAALLQVEKELEHLLSRVREALKHYVL